jgi:hypothetical protein
LQKWITEKEEIFEERRFFSQPSRLVEFDKTILVKNTYFMSASVKI